MQKELKLEERKGFDEVVLAPEEDKVIKHLKSCKKCKKECYCPLGTEMPLVLKLAKEKKFQEAKSKALETNPFLGICSRLCSALCQDSCSKKIKVKAFLRFLADSVEEEDSPKSKVKKTKPKKIAIIGGGLSGLTAAYTLAKQGYHITIYEAMDKLGGFLNFKIPEFRLSKKALERDIQNITSLPNIQLKLGTVIGHAFGVPQLLKMFSAVLVCTGANKPAFMHIPGEALLNVYTASEFLSGKGNEKGGDTLIVGGGNSALDAARFAKRLESDVTVIYRRSMKEMPADKELIKHSIDEGVKFLFLTRPTKILGDSKVESIELEQLMLGERDFDERKRPIPIDESTFQLPCDKIIIAVGVEPNPSIGKTRTIRTVGKERVWINQDYMTSIPGVFAAGDVVNNGKDILSTMKSALEASEKIDEYLQMN